MRTGQKVKLDVQKRTKEERQKKEQQRKSK